MSRVQFLEQQIAELSKWISRLDDIAWDQQLEEDADNGKLARLAEASLKDHAAGRSTEL
jgi:hypothetical protein